MPGVTISAGYGAAGSVVAPEVARLLDLPLLDRAISSEVAQKLRVTVAEAEEGAERQSLRERFLSLLAPLSGGVLGAGTDAAPVDFEVDEGAAFREPAEQIMRDALQTGAVILGRAGGAAFVHEPDVLRVRLFGSVEARIAQAARVEGTDEATARDRLPSVDKARAHYVRRLYRVDVNDPALYQLQLDSTVLSPQVCAQLIATAYRSLVELGQS